MNSDDYKMSTSNFPNQPATASSSQAVKPRQLCQADCDALDALLAARQAQSDLPNDAPNAQSVDSLGPMPPGAGRRTQRLGQLLQLLNAYDASLARDPSPAASTDPTSTPNVSNDQPLKSPPPPAPDQPSDEDQALIQSTLDRVQNERQRQRFARQVHQLAEVRPPMGVSWRQVLSAAAVFVVGLSLLMPVLNKNQADARRTACAANLQSAGTAFAAFAADHEDQMPRYKNLDAQNQWWRVGGKHEEGKPPRSNSANLYLLVRQGYIQPTALNCPANQHAPSKSQLSRSAYDFPNYQAISYSYQNQFRAKAIHMTRDKSLAVLADKNPLFEIQVDKFGRRQGVANTAPSAAHGQRGQNILNADGTVLWTARPIIRSPHHPQADNLWTLAGVTTYTGHETPRNHYDNFLVP